MGSDQSHQSTFQKDEWDLVERTSTHQLWRSRKDPGFHIQQYDIYSRDSNEQSQETQSFEFRFRQPQLVSSIFYKGDEEHEFCSSNHTNHLFLQKIPIKLSDIQHIPYPDTLHLYFQSLLGFNTIAKKYGYFQVQEQHIGVNQKAVVKVWFNQDFSKSYITGGKISQEQMVKCLIDILDKNCDPNLPDNIPTIRNYLYRNADTLTFNQAIQELKSYSMNYNQGYVTQRLECVERVGGIYAIANRVSAQTDSPQTPRTQNTMRGMGNGNSGNYQGFERPRISSDYSIPSEQNIPYRNANNGQVSSQFNLKASQALPSSSREEIIINPNAYREDVQIVRKRRNDLQIQGPGPQGYPQNNQMRYSQIIQPVQVRQLQSPIKSSQINLSYQPQSFARQPQPLDFPRTSTDHNEITFKTLSHNQQEPLQIKNTSIANFSLGPSQPSTHRGARNSLALQQETQSQSIQSQKVQEGFGQRIMRQVQQKPQADQVPQGQQISQVPQGLITQIPQGQQLQQIPQGQLAQQVSQGQILQYQQQIQKSPQLQQIQISPRPQFQPLIIEQPQPIQSTKFTTDSPPNSFSPNSSKPEKPSHFKPQPQPKKQSTFQQPKQEISYNNISGSRSKTNYQTINADDGKSSEEFMKKLKEITQGISSHSQIKAQANNKSELTYQPSDYSSPSNQPSYSAPRAEVESFAPKYSYQAGPTIQPTTISADDQDFGRIAVSNIIETHDPGYSKLRSFDNQPLKFENNLAMKYSVLQVDEPQHNFKSNVSRGNFGKYEMNLDADLMADLKKMKE